MPRFLTSRSANRRNSAFAAFAALSLFGACASESFDPPAALNQTDAGRPDSAVDISHAEIACARAEDCADKDPCTTDVCGDDGRCHTAAKCAQGERCCDGRCGQCCGDGDCDDRVACTQDRCVAGVCANVPSDAGCGEHEYCALGQGCARDVECTSPAQCDDGAPCTTDRCNDGVCAHDFCATGTLCCPGVGCAECCNDAQCEDGDPCTANRCSSGKCSSAPRSCGAGGSGGAGGTGGSGGAAAGAGGTSGTAGTAGASGNGGTAGGAGEGGGSGGAWPCPPHQKRCGASCVEPGPNVGCSPDDCTPCTGLPDNAVGKCDKKDCDFECKPGFKRDGERCVSHCEPERCGDCGPLLGAGCCNVLGQCGCMLLGSICL